MSDLIHVTIVGRLTRDAELRETNSGSVCGFRVAAKPYRADESLFIDASLWGKRGEAVVQYLLKGQQVVVIGDLSERKWEKDGEERRSLQVNASEVVLVGSRSEAPSADTGESDSAAESDLPF